MGCLKKLGILFTGLYLVLHCGIVSADNFWVLGSFKSDAAAQRLALRLETDLSLTIRKQETVVNGIPRHRLLVSELDVDPAMENQLAAIGISPWLMTLPESGYANAGSSTNSSTTSSINTSAKAADSKAAQDEPASLPPVSPGGSFLVLVGSFTDIDQALALERRLAREALSVRGEAKLTGGQVIHQVWVGPASNMEAVKSDLQRLDIAMLEVRSATTSEVAYIDKPVAQVAKQKSAKKNPEPAANNRYPRDFNLARLPEKRIPFPIKP